MSLAAEISAHMSTDLPKRGKKCTSTCAETKAAEQQQCCAEGLVCDVSGTCQLALGSKCKLSTMFGFGGPQKCGKSFSGPNLECGSADAKGDSYCCIETYTDFKEPGLLEVMKHAPPDGDKSKCCSGKVGNFKMGSLCSFLG